MRAAIVAFALSAAHAHGEAPVAKVLSMMSDLQATIIKEGEVAQKEYAEYSEWCEDRASNLGYDIKTGKSEAANLKASIAQEEASLQNLAAKIDELTASIETNEADLKAATEIRAAEEKDFAAEESELVSTLDMLRRATAILEREMRKGGASMLQWKTADSIAQAFSAMVSASLITTGDATKLTAFLQDTRKSQEEDEEPGAPAASTYESHSSNILETLESLTEKAESQLDNLRKTETADIQNFEMLKQSLQDELRFENSDLDDAKKGESSSGERKANAEGGLGVTSKDLDADESTKSTLHHDCMTKAQTFEAETKSRGEELQAIADAKKALSEATSFLQPAFLQLASSRLASSADLAKYEAVRFVRDLARQQKSQALMQLASRMAAAMHTSDPFAKIKGLIADMIDKLESEAGADATEKAYCDKELSETHAKKDDKTNEIQKITTRVDRMAARSAELKEEISALQSSLSKLASSQASMDQIRQEEKSSFDESKAELEKGLTGIKMALKILNEYYAKDGKAHTAAEGAGSSIISLLEVVEADFSKNLAQVTADEETAAAEYDRSTKDNEIEKTSKDQDVKYKTKESKYLDKNAGELSADRSGVQAELDAVMEYLSKLQDRCIAKAETYAERKARFEAEIAGLKQALTVLETETAFVQRDSHRTLRGASRRQ